MHWIELSAGSPAFWAGLFGWTLDGGVFRLDGAVVAGHRAGGPPAWTPHLLLDEPAAPALVTDPTGASFAVRAGGPRAEVQRCPGALSWAELHTPDPVAAETFYADRFGWTPVGTTLDLPGGPVPYTVFCRDGTEVAGLLPLGPFPGPPRWLAYVEVADCAALADRALAAGGAAVVPPLDIPRIGRVAVLAAPTGDELAVIQMP